MGRTLPWLLATGAGVLVLVLVLSPSSLQQSSPQQNSLQEGLCRAFLKERLLNPETVQFAEFTELSQEQYVQRLLKAAYEGRNIPADVAAAVQPRLESMTRKLAADMAATGAEFYEYRVRAEGRLGNLVTSSQYCAASEDQCACLSAEDYRERFNP